MEEIKKEKKYKPRGRRAKNESVQLETKLAILDDWQKGMSAKKLAEKYKLSVSYIYVILDSKEIRDVVKAAAESNIQSMLQTFSNNYHFLEKMMTRYMEESLDEGRIKSTSLASLMTTFGVASDKYFRLAELQMRQEELRLKKREAEMQQRENGAIITEFVDMMSKSNTLPEPEAEEEESE